MNDVGLIKGRLLELKTKIDKFEASPALITSETGEDLALEFSLIDEELFRLAFEAGKEIDLHKPLKAEFDRIISRFHQLFPAEKELFDSFVEFEESELEEGLTRTFFPKKENPGTKGMFMDDLSEINKKLVEVKLKIDEFQSSPSLITLEAGDEMVEKFAVIKNKIFNLWCDNPEDCDSESYHALQDEYDTILARFHQLFPEEKEIFNLGVSIRQERRAKALWQKMYPGEKFPHGIQEVSPGTLSEIRRDLEGTRVEFIKS